MALIYDPAARAELLEAAAYYEECRPGLGKAFLSAVEHAVARLSNNRFNGARSVAGFADAW